MNKNIISSAVIRTLTAGMVLGGFMAAKYFTGSDLPAVLVAVIGCTGALFPNFWLLIGMTIGAKAFGVEEMGWVDVGIVTGVYVAGMTMAVLLMIMIHKRMEEKEAGREFGEKIGASIANAIRKELSR